MAKSLKDILAGVKSSKIVPGSTGSDPGVDYAPKAPNEQEFVKKHSTEKHADRVGNGDDVYRATNVKHVLASPKEDKHGHKRPNDKSVYEAKEQAKCNMTAEGTACPVHEMADCTKSKPLREIAKNPYAIGMAAAMKQTGDKPPLKKSTITKAHDIAKSVKEDAEQVEEATKSGDASWRVPAHVKKHLEDKHGAAQSIHVSSDGSKITHSVRHLDDDGMDHYETRTHEYNGKDPVKDRKVGKLIKHVKPKINENVEEIEEVSKDTLQRYMHAAKPERMDPTKGKQRRAGMDLALKKSLGTKDVKVKAAGLSKKEREYHGMKEDLAQPLLGGDDESAEMAKTQLRALANKALHLAMQLSDDQVVEPWVQSKIAVAKDYVTAVHDYMIYGDHAKDKENEQTAPYEGGIDMTGAPRNAYPDFSADVNTGRVV